MSRTRSAHPRAAHRALFSALFGLAIAIPVTAVAQSDSRGVAGGVTGRVTDASGVPVSGAAVRIPVVARVATTDSAGDFRLDGLAPGRHTLAVRAPRFAPAESSVTIVAGAVTRVDIRLQPVGAVRLRQVLVRERAAPGSVGTARDVNGPLVLAGAKSDVVQVAQMDANLAEKTARQVFARVPGIFVYDMDGAGNQMNVSTRGLDPHRSWELNVRQDGVLVNSDLYGYPASHYSPPLEAMERLELVRGTAALQYGSQFGGLVNYVTKTPDTSRAASFESINSAGSYGLLSTYDAVGGRVGPLTYYGYVSARVADGYRANARSDYAAQYLRAAVRVSPSLAVRAQVGRSVYRYRIPGPLTDAMFRADPRASTRSRNYFSPDITVPSLTAEWTPAPATRVTAQLSGVVGTRSSVQFVGFATTPDRPDSATGQYAPRQVDIDRFRSVTGELRLLHDWRARGRAHTLAAGVALADNAMRRRQQGRGTTGRDYDLTLVSGDFARDITYRTGNVAAYVEQLLRLTPRWSLVPGARIERGTTRMAGRLAYYDPADVPRRVRHHFPLFGVRTELQGPGGAELYGGWSQAYRPQILKDVLPESPIERTDPDIRDARGWTLEGGVRGALGGVSYDAGVFALRYDDRFGAVVRTDAATGESYVFKTNVGSTLTRGVELRVEVPLLVRERLAVRTFTATSYFDAAYRAGTVVDAGSNRPLLGNRVEGVPEWISRTGITATGPRWSATLLGSHVGPSFADPLNTAAPTANGARGRVPAYTLLDLNGSVTVAHWLRLGVGVSNALDARYFTKRPTFYPGPGVWPSDGRSVRGSAELSF